jgi:hypothetical protein
MRKVSRSLNNSYCRYIAALFLFKGKKARQSAAITSQNFLLKKDIKSFIANPEHDFLKPYIQLKLCS